LLLGPQGCNNIPVVIGGLPPPPKRPGDLYGSMGGCGAQRKGASIYTWNPEALLGIALIKGFVGFKIDMRLGI